VLFDQYPYVVKANWNQNKRHLSMEMADEAEVESIHQEITSRKGFMAPLPVELPLFTKVAVEVRLDTTTRMALQAEVAQAFPLRSGNWNIAFLTEETPRLHSVEESELLAEEDEKDEKEEAADESETRGVAPIYRIQQMNPNEKARLATRAGRQERQVLLRDSSPLVLQSLLSNPRIESKDILRIVKSTHANAGLLKRIAEDGRWGKNQEILAHVARNPKTPPPLVTRLMDRLRTSDLRLMSKMSSGLREDVRQAALREYLRRSGT
jgi:hypothetical protein